MRGVLKLGKRKIRTPAVCASVQAPDIRTMKKLAEGAVAEGADLIEVRIDNLKRFNGWERLLDAGAPLILTNRSRREGGRFSGSDSERIQYLVEGIECGVDCVDLEFNTPEKLAKRIFEKARQTSVILSFHDFKRTPKSGTLVGIAKQMSRLPSQILKLVTMARTMKEAQRILEFTIVVKDEVEQPVIAFAMGEPGTFTRFIGPVIGVPIIYAAAGRQTAPGQLSVEETVKMLKSIPAWEVKD